VCDYVPYFHSSVSNVNFVLWKCVCVGGGGVQKYSLYAQMSIQCVECGITEIYVLLVARNILKYISLLFIYLVLRHIALLVANLVVARNWSLA